MASIRVQTNLPADKFTDGGKAGAIVAKVASTFGLPEEHIFMSFQTDAKFFYRGSADPAFYITVTAAPRLVTDDSVKLAIQLLTKRVQEDFSDIPSDRIVIFIYEHPSNRAGVKGVTMEEYAASQ